MLRRTREILQTLTRNPRGRRRKTKNTLPMQKARKTLPVAVPRKKVQTMPIHPRKPSRQKVKKVKLEQIQIQMRQKPTQRKTFQIRNSLLVYQIAMGNTAESI